MLRRSLILGGVGLCAVVPVAGRAQSTVPTQDITTILAGSPDHARFVEALARTGIAQQLRGAGPFTVFAPTNAAWDSIPINIRNDVLPPDGTIDTVRATAAMNAYIVPGLYLPDALAGRSTEVETRNGRRVRIDETQGKIHVSLTGGSGFSMGGASVGAQSANVTGPGLLASNGIVYIIDAPLVP